MATITTKTCKVHGDTDYVLRKDGRYRCKKCAVDSVLKRRKTTKEQVVEYKGGKCSVCGCNIYNQKYIENKYLEFLDKI